MNVIERFRHVPEHMNDEDHAGLLKYLGVSMPPSFGLFFALKGRTSKRRPRESRRSQGGRRNGPKRGRT